MDQMVLSDTVLICNSPLSVTIKNAPGFPDVFEDQMLLVIPTRTKLPVLCIVALIMFMPEWLLRVINSNSFNFWHFSFFIVLFKPFAHE